MFGGKHWRWCDGKGSFSVDEGKRIGNMSIKKKKKRENRKIKNSRKPGKMRNSEKNPGPSIGLFCSQAGPSR